MALTVRDCYRLLEVSPGASATEIKRAYRRLARHYHPDSGSRSASAEKFAAVSQAYRALMERVARSNAVYSAMPPTAPEPVAPPPSQTPPPAPPVAPPPPRATARNATPPPPQTPPPRSGRVRRSAAAPSVQVNPALSQFEQELKENAYRRLQGLFQSQRFPSAIALAEGLAQRLDRDEEVRQWLAIAYHRWGRELINRGQGSRAEMYLKKALNTDPRNRQLWLLVDHELQRLSLRSS